MESACANGKIWQLHVICKYLTVDATENVAATIVVSHNYVASNHLGTLVWPIGGSNVGETHRHGTAISKSS